MDHLVARAVNPLSYGMDSTCRVALPSDRGAGSGKGGMSYSEGRSMNGPTSGVGDGLGERPPSPIGSGVRGERLPQKSGIGIAAALLFPRTEHPAKL